MFLINHLLPLILLVDGDTFLILLDVLQLFMSAQPCLVSTQLVMPGFHRYLMHAMISFLHNARQGHLFLLPLLLRPGQLLFIYLLYTCADNFIFLFQV